MAEMSFWMMLFGIGGVLILLVLLRVERFRSQQIETGYQAKKMLYDSNERVFLGHLVWAVGRHVIIFGKVRLADVITIPKGLSQSIKQKAFDKIARQHLDFVLCDKRTTQILCVVELYDPGASPKKTLLRARFIDRVMKEAGIPIARFPRAKQYLAHEIESAIRQTLAQAGVTWAQEGFDPRAA